MMIGPKLMHPVKPTVNGRAHIPVDVMVHQSSSKPSSSTANTAFKRLTTALLKVCHKLVSVMTPLVLISCLQVS